MATAASQDIHMKAPSHVQIPPRIALPTVLVII